MSLFPLMSTTERTPITLREFLTEMEAAITRHPWLADAPLRIPGEWRSVDTGMGPVLTQNDPQLVTSISSGCSASTHYILLK